MRITIMQTELRSRVFVESDSHAGRVTHHERALVQSKRL